MIKKYTIKKECKPCNALGRWFTGNGGGHQAICARCNGKCYDEIDVKEQNIDATKKY